MFVVDLICCSFEAGPDERFGWLFTHVLGCGCACWLLWFGVRLLCLGFVIGCATDGLLTFWLVVCVLL